MGSWTALWLQRRGQEVTLVDQHGPASRLSSSGDETRVTRSGHGADRHYPAWQRRALDQWRALGREAGVALFVDCGVVWFVRSDTGFEAASVGTLEGLGIPVERWDPGELARRVPIVRADGLAWAMFEPEAGALLARRGVDAVVDRLLAEGGRLELGAVVPPAPEVSVLDGVDLADGRRLPADAVVFACGPWLPRLFPDLLGSMIVPTRQDVVHFAAPAGDPRWRSEAMPIWLDYDASYYGFPSIDGRGLKCCPDWPGPAVDASTADRLVAAETVAVSRAYLRERFPGLADQPVSESWACLYETTPDTNFVIDRHPTLANTWIAGGGSGHAFKHGPVIGEYLSALVAGDSAAAAWLAPPDDRFALRPRAPGTGYRSKGRRPEP